METLEQFLLKNLWMEDLSAAQQQLVRDTLYERHFNAGDIICRKGSPTDEWVGIIDGLAKISCESHTGKQISFITGIPSGSWVGRLAAEARAQAIRHRCTAKIPYRLHACRDVFHPAGTEHQL